MVASAYAHMHHEGAELSRCGSRMCDCCLDLLWWMNLTAAASISNDCDRLATLRTHHKRRASTKEASREPRRVGRGDLEDYC